MGRVAPRPYTMVYNTRNREKNSRWDAQEGEGNSEGYDTTIQKRRTSAFSYSIMT